MGTTIEKEFMWKMFVQKYQHKEIAREINTQAKRFIEYTDGTTVELLPVASAKGKRHTHLYVSKKVIDMSTSSLMNNLTNKMMSFDNQSKPERVMTFEFINHVGIAIEPYAS